MCVEVYLTSLCWCCSQIIIHDVPGPSFQLTNHISYDSTKLKLQCHSFMPPHTTQVIIIILITAKNVFYQVTVTLSFWHQIVIVCTKFEDIPSKLFWDTAFMRMGRHEVTMTLTFSHQSLINYGWMYIWTDIQPENTMQNHNVTGHLPWWILSNIKYDSFSVVWYFWGTHPTAKS